MNDELTLYFDSSALVKLVMTEAETSALRRLNGRAHECYSSTLARAEVPRAVRRIDVRAPARAHLVLDELDLIEVDEDLLADSAKVGEAALRTLDAIHLAAAQTLGDQLDALVTYDHRMAEAARGLGIRVESPA